MRVLVVEDEAIVAQAIAALLVDQRYAVDIAADGLEGLAMAEAYTYDLMVLDVGLPQLDGISLCQRLRAQEIQTPILLLTGQAVTAHAKATALNAGADDYVTKPFDAAELLARVQSLLRRGNLKTLPILRWGALRLAPSRVQASYGETLLQLTPKEYALLEVLLRHAPNIVSAGMILEHGWNALKIPGEEVVRYHLKELRKKLKVAGAPQDFIKTVHRQGYRLNPLYGEEAAAGQEAAAGTLQVAELKALNEELRNTLEQLQATQAALQQSNQDLQAARDELEVRVAERTAELRQREAFLNRIYEGAEQPIFVVAVTESGDFRYVSHNRSAQESTGISLEDFQDKTPEAVFGSDLGSQFRRHYERCVQANHSITYEDHFTFNDRPYWILTTLSPLRGDTGSIDRLVGTTLDISDRKLAETALRESEERFRTLANTAPALIWYNDAEGHNLYINQYFLDFTGKSTEDIRGEGWHDLVHPDDAEAYIADYLTAVHEQRPWHNRNRVCRHDGQWRWLENYAQPLFDAEGEYLGHVGVSIDNTNEIETKQALSHSEAQLSRIFDNAGAAIGEFLAYPDRTFVPGLMSVGCERVYGYSPAEMIEDTQLWLSRVLPEDVETVIMPAFEQIFTSNSFVIEYRFRDKANTIRWIAETLTSHWDEAAGCWQVTTVAVDTSDRKQTELALRESQEQIQQQLAEIETIYQSAPIGLNVLDTDLRFVRINQRLAEMNGLPVEAHIGRTVREVLPDLADRAEELLRSIFVTGEPLLNVEITGETPAQPGVQRTWLESFWPLKDGDRVIGISTVCKEITEHKQAEQALQQSEAKNQAILAALPDLLIRFDANGVYREILASGCDFEVLSTGAVGRSMFEVLPTDLAEQAYHYLQQALQTGELQVFEQALLIDNQRQYEEARVIKSADDEVLFIIRNISEQKRLDAERQQAELALQQQIRQEKMLADIAQEIRQSLNLEQVLHSTVNRIRQWLACDRVIIFRFRPDWQGDVIMESVRDNCVSILSTTIVDPCFEDRFIEPYRQGHVSVLNDINQPGLEPCYVEFLKQFRVHASLAVPIFQGQGLWGLLIAHQCTASRQWQAAEITILKRLSTQVGIAIHQAELYEQIRWELAQRAHMQTVLQESEERFRTLSAAAPVGILQANADGICLYANDAWQQMSGLSLLNSLGDGWLQAVHPNDRDWVSQAWAAHVEHQREGQAEFRLLTPNQAIRWISARVATIQSATDDVVGYVSTYEDITERKQAEEALRESEQRLQAILDHSPAVIYMFDAQNRHLLVNRSYADLLSTTPADLIGKHLHEVWPAAVADGFVAQNQIILETGKLLQIEDAVPLADGIHSYITVKFPLSDAVGNLDAICGISTDITEKKHLEAQFYQAQRLESLGTLAGGIAHDLNNILTPILTVAQMLQLTQQGLNAKDLERLKLIETSAKRGANLVKQILTVTRTSQGERTPVDLVALLQEEIEILLQSFPKAIHIRAEIPPSEGTMPALGMILADPTYLHQIILNLCINARDAMPDGGTLTLSAATVLVDEAMASQNLGAQVGPYAVVTVTDTGTGIPIAVQERMFDPFFTTKAPGQGTGLGLSTVRSLVEATRGFLQVSSEVGRGTQFRVYFPLLDSDLLEQSPSTSQSEVARGPCEARVLVVEDEEMVRSMLRSLLESAHYQVVMARDGAEALEQYGQQRSQIQLVITDIMMPNVDGITLIRNLRSLNPAVKILALSGVSTHEENALAAGADNFLAKPFDLESLLSCVAALLSTIN